jgi:hypothetical protein
MNFGFAILDFDVGAIHHKSAVKLHWSSSMPNDSPLYFGFWIREKKAVIMLLYERSSQGKKDY